METTWASRRSPVYSLHGACASSQPLASSAGAKILCEGGNAADACVAIAAVLNLTEPCSTGIGGDAFCLFYDAATKKVSGLNGSGRSPAALNLATLKAEGIGGDSLPLFHAHTVTVPGAAAAWADTITRFGKLSLPSVLAPAIKMARNGFPVHPVAAHGWQRGAHLLQNPANKHGGDMLMPNGEAPSSGDVMINPNLANTFERLAKQGKDGFYRGEVAKAIVETVQEHGGVMTLEDLEAHIDCDSGPTTDVTPISVDYCGVTVHEIPPNGQGLTALIALNILSELEEDLADLGHNSAEYLHLLIEALRLAFADTNYYVCDLEKTSIPLEGLLSREYAKTRAALIDRSRAVVDPVKGSPVASSDTVQFTVVDKDGNACSFINSNYCGFGTGLIPVGCGFTLQNRGANFSLVEGHPNCLEGRKRPYHTIIPGMATKDGELFCSFGVMGGFMQPQGHVQVLANMIHFGMDPQQALDAPRFCIGPGHSGASGNVSLEKGIPAEVADSLKFLGHTVTQGVAGHERALFGRGQIIKQERRQGRKVTVSGSDPRADGCAYPQLFST